MNSLIKAISCLALISVLTVISFAQTTKDEVKHFAADGVSFDYSPAWSLSDESTPEHQRLVLTQSRSDKLTILVKRGFVSRSDSAQAIENQAQQLITSVANAMGKRNGTPQQTNIQIQIGPTTLSATQLEVSDGPKIGKVICFRIHLRVIAVGFVKSGEVSGGLKLWDSIRSSLEVEPPVLLVKATDAQPESNDVTGGVLNGRALSLPKPAYPALARAAHASGTVKVLVIVDEQGDVISASIVSGHPLLQAACIAAARGAKFSPTALDGEPVRVSGVIDYNFVAQ